MTVAVSKYAETAFDDNLAKPLNTFDHGMPH